MADAVKSAVSKERYNGIEAEIEKHERANTIFAVGFLTSEERRLVEVTLAELELADISGGRTIASTGVESPQGDLLNFEALIEDDGGCIDLLTPYDERDGRFVPLDDKHFVYEMYGGSL